MPAYDSLGFIGGLTSIQGTFGPKETMDRLVAEINANRMKVFAPIDDTVGAAQVGLTLRPTELIIFGNARGGTSRLAVAQIVTVEDYKQAFQRVFGRASNGPDLLRAIASYERTRMSFDSPFHHFVADDKNAISESAKHGWELFNIQARCNKCHALTDTQRDKTDSDNMNEVIEMRWGS
jgi:Di-haem cytochrome c peroxidase